MKKYEEELKSILKTITPNVESYFGEFSSLNDVKIDTRKMPFIYIDFLGDAPSSNKTNTLSFSLYLVNAVFSANEKTRDEKRHDLYYLIDESSKILNRKSILKSGFMKAGKSIKILDAKAQNAYLVIFKKDLTIDIEE